LRLARKAVLLRQLLAWERDLSSKRAPGTTNEGR